MSPPVLSFLVVSSLYFLHLNHLSKAPTKYVMPHTMAYSIPRRATYQSIGYNPRPNNHTNSSFSQPITSTFPSSVFINHYASTLIFFSPSSPLPPLRYPLLRPAAGGRWLERRGEGGGVEQTVGGRARSGEELVTFPSPLYGWEKGGGGEGERG